MEELRSIHEVRLHISEAGAISKLHASAGLILPDPGLSAQENKFCYSRSLVPVFDPFQLTHGSSKASISSSCCLTEAVERADGRPFRKI